MDNNVDKESVLESLEQMIVATIRENRLKYIVDYKLTNLDTIQKFFEESEKKVFVGFSEISKVLLNHLSEEDKEKLLNGDDTVGNMVLFEFKYAFRRKEEAVYVIYNYNYDSDAKFYIVAPIVFSEKATLKFWNENGSLKDIRMGAEKASQSLKKDIAGIRKVIANVEGEIQVDFLEELNRLRAKEYIF